MDTKFINSIEIIHHPHHILTSSLEDIFKEKRNLEKTHKSIVSKALNPFIDPTQVRPQSHSSRQTHLKKVHRINCPVIPTNPSVKVISDIPASNLSPELKYEDVQLESSFISAKIPLGETFNPTSIFYAEDLFGSSGLKSSSHRLSNKTSKALQNSLRCRINNPYVRTIAGSSTKVFVGKSCEYEDDPLKTAESRLPKRFRSVVRNSPWTYSSILRMNAIYKVKSRLKR